jgi:hypothetical protein
VDLVNRADTSGLSLGGRYKCPLYALSVLSSICGSSLPCGLLCSSILWDCMAGEPRSTSLLYAEFRMERHVLESYIATEGRTPIIYSPLFVAVSEP